MTANDKQPKMGPSKIDYRNEKITKNYSWNPGGWGCSNLPDCPGCWSKSQASFVGGFCPDCKAFRVHLHEERLAAPANTKKPGVVLVNFTCDTWDLKRSSVDIGKILDAALAAPWHTYVFLTKQAAWLRAFFEGQFGQQFIRDGHPPDNWHLGLTIRNQADADAKLPDFLQVQGNKWLSLEPLWDGVDLENAFFVTTSQQDKARAEAAIADGGIAPVSALVPGLTYRRAKIAGVIIGHDNRANAPGTKTLEHIRSVVCQCEAAGVNVFVKQLWMEIGGKRKLVHDPEQFPDDLRHRDLPWTFPNKEQQP